MTQKRSWTGIATAALVLSIKSAKIIKAFKVAKPLVMFLSMGISAFAYAFWLGPWFGIGLVVLLLIHEMGHVVALRLRGYEATTPVFIPFLGALIFAPKFTDRDNEAFVGYGGPLLGSVGAVALFAVWFFLPPDSVAAHLVLITSFIGVYLNLFNMIPLSPLDGGRITQATGEWFKYLGVTLLAGFTLYLREPALLLIWVLVLPDLTMIPIRLRIYTAIMCAVGMTVLMVLGYSGQPWWVNMIDITIVTFYCGALYAILKHGSDEFVDARPDLPLKTRIKWFSLYAVLTVALTMLLVYQTSLLPKQAQTNTITVVQ